jgi:hypothetical protein
MGSANHRLWVLHMHHTHPLDFFGREETKLNLLDRAQWRLGVWKVDVRHDGDERCDRDYVKVKVTVRVRPRNLVAKQARWV